jgi:hypothetical protein
MISHHQGAIDIARAELKYGHNEKLRGLAQDIITERTHEMSAMRSIIGEQRMRITPVAVQEIVTFRELSVRRAGRKAPVSSRPYLVEPKSARRPRTHRRRPASDHFRLMRHRKDAVGYRGLAPHAATSNAKHPTPASRHGQVEAIENRLCWAQAASSEARAELYSIHHSVSLAS